MTTVTSRRPCNDFSQLPHAPVAIIPTPGGEALATLIDHALVAERKALVERHPRYEDCPGFYRESYIVDASCPRFSNGEGKAVIHESIRGFDIYCVTDVGNAGISYLRNGRDEPMSPDEHFQDLKRVIAATRGFGMRLNVIMPLLYEGRQHKVSGRESLDCAMALQELVHLGVKNIMTIDAHNSHVQNSIPNYGFENLHANYQQIKGILKNEPEFEIGREHLVVTSPDLGGLERCRYFAEQFHAELTAFYKVRDLSRVVNGKNPILAHRFLGADIKGKSALVIDDLVASGDSVLECARYLKEMGARRVSIMCTFALFTEGIAHFNEAHKAGTFDRVYGTNATFARPELESAPWYIQVDVSKFIASYIDVFNRNESVGRLLDNSVKIRALLDQKGLA